MIDQVQRAHTRYAEEGAFRGAQLEVKLSMEYALRLMTETLQKAREDEDESADKLVLTLFAHPPADD